MVSYVVVSLLHDVIRGAKPLRLAKNLHLMQIHSLHLIVDEMGCLHDEMIVGPHLKERKGRVNFQS